MNKNILISGGCGFIGINLVDYLLKNLPKANIRIFDNLTVGRKEDLKEVCDFKEIHCKDIKKHLLVLSLLWRT